MAANDTTEKEAMQKWCPFSRTGLTAGMAVNRHVADAPGANDGVYDETRCRGSECAVWVWDDGLPEGMVDMQRGHCGMRR